MSGVLSEALSGIRSAAIGGHVRPDGDCVGACLGLYNYILTNYPNIHVDVYLEPVPEVYRQVRGTDQVISDFSGNARGQDSVGHVRPNPDTEEQGEHPESGAAAPKRGDPGCAAPERYDLFVALDCSDKERLGGAARWFDSADRTLCIDHHISNRAFAGTNVIRPDASSSCEVLFDLMDEDRIDLETARCLYMGIMCDTGCFKHSNTKEHTLNIVGRLITKGVDSSKMIDEIFYQKTFMQNQLLGRCLVNSYLALDGRCIVSVATQRLLSEYGAVSSDLEGVIDQLRVTKGVEVAVLLTEDEEGGCKISMRSKSCVDVAAVAVAFGGGGHVRAAGASVALAPEAVIGDLLDKIGEQLTDHV